MKSDIKPFELHKNIYFVGSSRVSVHIIKTEQGLVMIDTGYPDMLEQILDSMNVLNLNPKDLCAIFHSHGHIDHIGCTTQLKKLSGAKTYIGIHDSNIVNGKKDLSGADILGIEKAPLFDADVVVNDGDEFDFGDVKIKCLLTPGHTEGVISLFIKMPDNLVAAMHGGVGINTMNKKYLTSVNLPLSLRDDFFKGIERLSDLEVDLVLGNHPEQNNTVQKIEALEQSKSIINKTEWQKFLNLRKEMLLNTLKEEEENV